jgi:hypothetical protein
MSALAALGHPDDGALDQLGSALAALLARRWRDHQASPTPPPIATADHRRPLGAGDQPTTTHEAAPSPAKSRRRFEEDDRHESVTSTDA